jgi:hypothetical protein
LEQSNASCADIRKGGGVIEKKIQTEGETEKEEIKK